ncbi:MAG: hypothetical protein Q4D22_03095 [Candidatus Saccharibacteria bacterium]|nr:hypothetical protein [Candidatus Saccharibacteria bacterium]
MNDESTEVSCLSISRLALKKGIQSRGGFIHPKDMAESSFDEDKFSLYTYAQLVETSYIGIPPSSLGTLFDYLLRTEMYISSGVETMDAIMNSFFTSVKGATRVNEFDKVRDLMINLYDCYNRKKENYRKIVSLAVQLVRYDTAFRSGYFDPNEKPYKVAEEEASIIDYMLKATQIYLMTHEKITRLGVSFNAIGAKNCAPSDADLLGEDALIDIKLIRKEPTSQHTLQLLLYYIMGLHEYHDEFVGVKYLKVLNPRKGKIYSYDIAKIDIDTLKHVEKNIMGYNESVF